MNLQQLQWDELKENLKEIIQNNPKASICLRIDRYAKNRHVKRVMEACAESGASDVIFATFEAGQ